MNATRVKNSSRYNYKGGSSLRCYYCNEEGHIAKICPKKPPRLCFNCGNPGHVKRDCPHAPSVNPAPPRLQRAVDEQPALLVEVTGLEDKSGGTTRLSPPGRNGQFAPKLPPDPGGRDRNGQFAPNPDTGSHDRNRQFAPKLPPDPGGHNWDRQFASKLPPDPGSHDRNGQLLPDPGGYSVEHRVTKNPGGNTVRVPQPFPSQPSTTAQDLKSAKFIDTHCHLEYVFERFKHQGSFADFMVEHSYPETYEGCITTFCDPTAFSPSFGIWQDLLSEWNVWGTFGTHPHNAKYYHSSSLEEKMVKCISHPKCVAVGEIGLDYAPHSPSDPDTQRRVLVLQLQMAVGLEKPVILHCRNAEDDLFALLTSTIPRDWKLHLHCFTGSAEMARKFLQTFPNLYIGICGNVTYATSPVQAIATSVPIERMLLETDAPYMVPRNLPPELTYKFSHPSLAYYTAKEIARIRHMNVVDVLNAIRKNTQAMYGV